ncbi:glutathione synthetase [Xylariaceae sp. FL0804]|nr:glutathione synthetase [Xylariaceae sp. FL0804]
MQLTPLTQDQIEQLHGEVEDYQIARGSLLKTPRSHPDLDSAVAVACPVGVSLRPTPFPRSQFRRALALQTTFNELYIRVVEDQDWLERVVVELAETDEFARKLWSIWERVKTEGEVQPLRCALFRSDYMLHGTEASQSRLKQVEFNAFSCAGMAHANIVGDMHRYLANKGAHEPSGIKLDQVPLNKSLRSVVNLLEAAHHAYGRPVGSSRRTAVLMTVQPYNVNICDERPIEYLLSECSPPVVLYRTEFIDEVKQKCSLGPSRELLFRPSPSSDPIEISVVYHRAGYDPAEYGCQGVETRYILERSRAIKCPTILSHMSGFKKIQQELAKPTTLERFLSLESADLLRKTFMPIYPMDTSPEGSYARVLATNKDTAENYILKPSLDGGNHNITGGDIPGFLQAVKRREWDKYILMEKILPPSTKGVLVSDLLEHQGPVISELGVVGACMWDRGHILANFEAGWTFKTKPVDVEEMSVVKGFGCFDCPLLFDLMNSEAAG